MNNNSGFLYTQLPWNFISKYREGVVVHKDGILQRSFAYRAPDVDSVDGFTINGIALRVNDFVKRLDSGWAVFFEAQRFFTTDYPKSDFSYPSGNFHALSSYLIDREREAAFRAGGRHFESSYYITFAWRPPSDSINKLRSMFIQRDGQISTPIKENISYFTSLTDNIASLISNDILIEPLNNSDTVLYLHSAVSLKRHPLNFPSTSILLDRILPDSALENSLTLKLGEHFIPIIGVNDFPSETYPAILDELNRARLEYRWVSRFICAGKEDGKKEAQKKEKAHRGNRKSLFQSFAEHTSGSPGEYTGPENHGASVKEADAASAGIEIETDEASLGFYTSNVMVWDENLKEAEKKAAAVMSIINSAGFSSKLESFNALEAWKSMMPGQVYANYRALPVMSYSLSHVLPLSSVWAGTRFNSHAGNVSGVDLPHLVCSTNEGTPFFLNLNVNDVGHTAVWGPTGSGKSTLLNLLETQFFKYPDSRVIVFDKGKSCRLPCLASGGAFYEPASDSPNGLSFQPLRELESDADISNAMDFIESLFLINNNPVSPLMRAAIKESLELLKDKPVKQRTITSFVHYANYTDPDTRRNTFKELLSDYLLEGGKFGKIFDSGNQRLSLSARFIAVEMETLMNRGPGAIVPALVFLFNLIEKQFTGNLTLLILDEAWLFLKHETFQNKITEWLKVLRKKNVFVVFATQDVADAANSPLKTTIIQQCLTKIYLADPSALTSGMSDVYRQFGLSDAEIYVIANARMKRDYFYTSPLGRRLFQLNLGQLTLSLIGSPDHAFIDQIISSNPPSFCRAFLDARAINYAHLIGNNAPRDVPPPAPPQLEPTPLTDTTPRNAPPQNVSSISALFDAIKTLPKKQPRGYGRAAAALASKFAVSARRVYAAKKILLYADPDAIAAVSSGSISFKDALNLIKQGKTRRKKPRPNNKE